MEQSLVVRASQEQHLLCVRYKGALDASIVFRCCCEVICVGSLTLQNVHMSDSQHSGGHDFSG